MAYQDHYGQPSSHRVQQEGEYDPYNPYTNNPTTAAPYNTYETDGPAHHDQGERDYDEYRDDRTERPEMAPGLSQRTMTGASGMAEKGAPVPGETMRSVNAGGLGGRTRFSEASFVPPKNTGDLRLWRHDEHGNVWTKGSRTRCMGRFCCCTIMTTLFLIISVVLTLGLWVRPPDISFNGIKTPTNGSTVVAQATGITINLNLDIGVVNPNFFAADFSSIEAQAFYPGVAAQIGGGSLSNINFPSHSDTTFLFPFAINYTEAIDPDKTIIKDIAVKCGFIGSSTSDIPVKYQLTLKLKIIGITISPSFGGTAQFACPLKASDIAGLGIDIGGLLGTG